jgi:aspartyl-tRNA(Asn)/glutamyl-tRNA(Gln) amidotransferase subunit A
MPDEIAWLAADELRARYASRTLSPVEVVSALLARAERLNPRLNAFITIMHESAQREARQAEIELGRGERRSPLHGVPVAIKDVIFTRGTRTTMGSRALADFVPDEEATLVERLRAGGAIILGKAHTPEFASASTGKNRTFGPCRNPYDLRRIPGGSSGGSAAAVAGGLCPIAIGTDTGGSIRIPAALCGAVGLKATHGRVSAHGIFLNAWTLDHPGPITRSVRDAALALGVIAGYDSNDPTTNRAPVPDYTAALTGDIRGLRVGVLREHQTAAMDADVATSFDRAVRLLAELGAQIETVSVPSIAYAEAATLAIRAVEFSAIHEQTLREHAADYDPEILHRAIAGFGISGVDYVRAQQVRGRITADLLTAFRDCDALASPTVGIAAPEIGVENINVAGQEEDVSRYLPRFTRWQNLTGFPVVTVASGYTPTGLPIGFQFTARHFDEAMAFRFADTFERATATERRRPSLD